MNSEQIDPWEIKTLHDVTHPFKIEERNKKKDRRE